MGITIDITALARLPQDGNISHLVSVTEDCSTVDTPIPEADRSTASEVKEEHLSQSFVPTVLCIQTVELVFFYILIHNSAIL